jgi:hypothetical protein
MKHTETEMDDDDVRSGTAHGPPPQLAVQFVPIHVVHWVSSSTTGAHLSQTGG